MRKELKERLKRKVDAICIPLPRELLQPHMADGIFRGFLRVSDVSVSNVQASSFAEELLIITVHDIAGAPLFSYGLRELSDAGAGHWEVLCEWLALGSQAMIPKGTNTTPARRPPVLERSRRTL